MNMCKINKCNRKKMRIISKSFSRPTVTTSARQMCPPFHPSGGIYWVPPPPPPFHPSGGIYCVPKLDLQVY